MNLYLIADGQAVEYERQGHCLACGQCCRKDIKYQWEVQMPVRVERKDRNEPDWYKDYPGWSMVFAMGAWWAFHVDAITDKQDAPCAQFCAATGQCRAFQDLQNFNQMCWFWPIHPKDLFPGCGFSFVRVEDKL